MPVHVAAWALSQLLTLSGLVRAALAVVVLAFVRQACIGINPNRLLDALAAESQREAKADTTGKDQAQRRVGPVRDLHGRLVLIASGGLDTALGLQLCHALIREGAHLVVLDPRPLSHPAVLQLVHILRASSTSALYGSDHDGDGQGDAPEAVIYAEQCDLADVRSVDAFVKTWERMLQPGRGGDAANPTLGQDPLMTRTDGVDANAIQALSSPVRRLDSIVFLPPAPSYHLGTRRQGVQYPLKDSSSEAHEELEVEREHALALGRLHFLLGLVPSLTTLPRERDICIINAVGPWYAAAAAIISQSTKSTEPLDSSDGKSSTEPKKPPAGLTSADLDWRGTPAISGRRKSGPRFSRWSPHLPPALADLTWLGIADYLQRRLDVLAGELTTGAGSASSLSTALVRGEGEGSPASRSRSNIRVLSVSTGLERSQTLATFLPSAELFAHYSKSPPSSQSSSTALHLIWLVLRTALWIALQPLAWLLLRSASHAANEVLWTIRAPVRAGLELVPLPDTQLHSDEREAGTSAATAKRLRQGEAVVPGKLHYQGNVIRTPLPPALQDEHALRALYRQEEARARTILERATPLSQSTD